MPTIPSRYRNKPGFRRFFKDGEPAPAPVVAEPEPQPEPESAPAPEPVVAVEPETVSADPEMPDYEAMAYAELRSLVSAEEEEQLPDRKKATLVQFLTEKWGS